MVNASGNGGGKTYGIVAALAAFMWPTIAPSCFASPIFNDLQAPKRARIISTPKEVEEIGSLQTAIKYLWPKDRYTSKNKGKSYPSQFNTDSGWIVDVMSYEQDSSEFAGPNIGVLIFNEPPPEGIWKESIARLRKGGVCLVAMTSLADNPWVVDGILMRKESEGFRVIYADIEENCKQHGINGTLEHDQIEKILNQYDPDEREARKTGKPLSLSGRILKSFDRNVHVAKDPIQVQGEGVAHYMVVDPAIGKPFACLWAFVDKTGKIHVYDEYPEVPFHGSKDSGLTVKEYAQIFLAKEKGKHIQDRILDRHFGNVRRNVGGLTLKQEFFNENIDFIDSYHVGDGTSEVETGIYKLKDYLYYDKTKEIDSSNQPKIIISPTCTNTITACEKWLRNPETGKPREEYKDFADLLRYLVMANPMVETDKIWAKPRTANYG